MYDLNKYLGVQFKVHGRDRNGYDCYGFLIDFAKDLGHTLTDLHKEYTEKTYMKEMKENASSFIEINNLIKIDKMQFGDVILFFDEKGRAVHVGAFLKNQDFIHCDKYGVRVSQLNTYPRKKWEGYTYG